MRARVLLLLSIMLFVGLTGPCVGSIMGDPYPGMTAAQKREDARFKAYTVAGWFSSGVGIVVSVTFVIAQSRRSRK